MLTNFSPFYIGMLFFLGFFSQSPSSFFSLLDGRSPAFVGSECMFFFFRSPEIPVQISRFPNSNFRAVGGLVRGNPSHYLDANLRMIKNHRELLATTIPLKVRIGYSIDLHKETGKLKNFNADYTVGV